MIDLNGIHHVAVICTDYERSKYFYTQVLGLNVIGEIFRSERNSYKLDLALNGVYVVELFHFPVHRNALPGLKQPACDTWPLKWMTCRKYVKPWPEWK